MKRPFKDESCTKACENSEAEHDYTDAGSSTYPLKRHYFQVKNSHFAPLIIAALFSLSMLHSGCQSGPENKGSSDTTKKVLMHTKSRFPVNISRPAGPGPDAAGNNASIRFGVKPPGTGGDPCDPGASLCSSNAGINLNNGTAVNFINSGGYAGLFFDPSKLPPDIRSYFMAYTQQAHQGAVVTSMGDCQIDPALVKLWNLNEPITQYSGFPMFLSTNVDSSGTMLYVLNGLIPGHRGVISIGYPRNNCDASYFAICNISDYTPDAANVALLDLQDVNGTVTLDLTFNLNAMQPGIAQLFSQMDTVNWSQGTIMLASDYLFTEAAAHTGVAIGSSLQGGTTCSYQPWPTIPWGSNSYVFSGWVTVFISPLFPPNAGAAMKQKTSMKKEEPGMKKK